MMLSLRILNNRFGFLGGFKQALQISDQQTLTPAQKESELRRRSTKMHSQLRELIHSKDLTDWISQMTKIWGPYCQALLEENICYLERLKKYVPFAFLLSSDVNTWLHFLPNLTLWLYHTFGSSLFRWVRPHQTWRVLALLSFYIFVTTFFPYLVVPAIGLFIGAEFFIFLPMQKYYPRFSHVFSPVEWILWGVPTNAELAVELLTQQEDDRRRSMEVEGNIKSAVEPFTRGEHEPHQDSASFVSGLSPASKIKYEYQKRRGRSPSDVSHVSDALSMDDLQEKSGKMSGLTTPRNRCQRRVIFIC